MRNPRTDITGMKFGKLTIVGVSDRPDKRHVWWTAVCECGARREVRHDNLKSGYSESCRSCWSYPDTPNRQYPTRRTPREYYRTPTWYSWKMMLERCRRKSHGSYPNYGGRGITVDATWMDFNRFLADMGPRPQGMTLDRINVNGNYCKSNCRWATNQQQAENRRHSILISYRGHSGTINSVSKKLGITSQKLLISIAKEFCGIN